MDKSEHTTLLKSLKGRELEFTETVHHGNRAFIAEPYIVVFYEWSHGQGFNIEENQLRWQAYYRVLDPHSKLMLFGNCCEYKATYRGVDYETVEEAMEACQRHLEGRYECK